MSLRRNTTPKNTEGGTTHRLSALLKLETRAAAVGGSGPDPILNDDLLKEIARRLAPKELCNASAVDRNTRTIVRNFVTFAKKYNLQKEYAEDGGFELILDISTTNLRTNDDVTAFKTFFNDLSTSLVAHLRVIPSFVSLRHSVMYASFTAIFVRLWDTAWEMYKEEIQRINGLKSLDVRYSFDTEDVFNMFLRGVRIFTSLEHLCIVSTATLASGYGSAYRDMTLQTQLTTEFPITLEALVHIKSLTLSYFLLNDEQSMRYLCDGLNALTKLSSLTIEQCALSNETWVQLATTLQSTSHLSTLHITQDPALLVEVDDAIVGPLRAMFERQTGMTSVSVRGTGLGCACIAALSQVDAASITFLDLSSNILHKETTGDRLEQILKSVHFLANVKRLNMSNTKLMHTDIPTLVKMIGQMDNLVNINLSGDGNAFLCKYHDLFTGVNMGNGWQEQQNLFDALSTRKRLQTIKLPDLSVRHIEALSDIAKAGDNVFHSLQHTDITFCRMEDESSRSKIVRAVENMPEYIRNRLKISLQFSNDVLCHV